MNFSSAQKKWGGLLVRRERWSLSLPAKIVLLLVAALLAWLLWHGIYPFLALNDGGKGEVMVVEGWISARRIDRAADAFRRGQYGQVLVVRDVYPTGDKWESGRYTADYVAADLIRAGVPASKLKTLFCPVVQKDRTYTCALAARQWLEQNQLGKAPIDVVTVAAHARRSRLLYRKTFPSVGVIAIEDPGYDPQHWWRSSEGVREVLGEMVAYLYARFLFWPRVN